MSGFYWSAVSIYLFILLILRLFEEGPSLETLNLALRILTVHQYNTHRDGVKSTSDHVSGHVFLFSCRKNILINHLSFYCIKQIDNIFPCVYFFVFFCSLHAVTSSVIYYSTHCCAVYCIYVVLHICCAVCMLCCIL